ncbi:crossover junction endodeoxyribonuclease RuvA [Gilliamella sp. Choc4-2]|uniref:RusA family crossover junction endodeoxyribonuclease n=1 Tax=Gilliamella sp. Choc4-2 TaxID=3120237 RepID=UPI00080DBCFA|nr:RusA family crossover junction endodeoxyribonuclease [Gilliamella apicola]OCG45693.1 crossover junction endodeoxyribonuclease RuvA [Gilliamella apicola]
MIYNITPVPKPRMTQRDRWAKRKPVLQYFAFKDACKASGVTLPESHYHIIFVIPMPKSWSNKKRAEMDGKPHQQRPDKDNLEKGLLDAIFGEDCRVWDGRVTKIWGNVGQIIIKNLEE